MEKKSCINCGNYKGCIDKVCRIGGYSLWKPFTQKSQLADKVMREYLNVYLLSGHPVPISNIHYKDGWISIKKGNFTPSKHRISDVQDAIQQLKYKILNTNMSCE